MSGRRCGACPGCRAAALQARSVRVVSSAPSQSSASPGYLQSAWNYVSSYVYGSSQSQSGSSSSALQPQPSASRSVSTVADSQRQIPSASASSPTSNYANGSKNAQSQSVSGAKQKQRWRKFQDAREHNLRNAGEIISESVVSEVQKNGGRVDIMATTTDGQTLVFEVKCYEKSYLRKAHIDQVLRYADDHNCQGILIISNPEKLGPRVYDYANEKGIIIMTPDPKTDGKALIDINFTSHLSRLSRRK